MLLVSVVSVLVFANQNNIQLQLTSQYTVSELRIVIIGLESMNNMAWYKRLEEVINK